MDLTQLTIQEKKEIINQFETMTFKDALKYLEEKSEILNLNKKELLIFQFAVTLCFEEMTKRNNDIKYDLEIANKNLDAEKLFNDNQYNSINKYKNEKEAEIKNLNRIIDLMAEEILRLDTEKSKFEYDHAKMWDTEKGIKEYFAKKAKGE